MTGPSATTSDANNAALEEKAIEQDTAGMTEGEKELANGEQIGDRVGDDAVAGVEQTRNGIGELLSEARAPFSTPAVVLKPGINGAESQVSHVEVQPIHVARIRQLLAVIEQDLGRLEHWAVVEIRSLFPQHAG